MYNSSTPLQQFLTFLFTSQRERKVMKGLTMEKWINFNQKNRSVLAQQYSVLGENWPYPPTASGSYGREGGKQAGRQNASGF